MEENKLFITTGDDTEADFALGEYVSEGGYDFVCLLKEVTPPESLKELEEKFKEWALKYGGKDNLIGMLDAQNGFEFLKPLISSMLQGKENRFSFCQREIEMDETERCETQCSSCKAYYAPLEVEKLNEQISSLQTQLQSKEDSLTHWRNEGYHAREELYKAKERIKQLEAELKKVQEAASQHDYMRGEQEKIITELRKKSRR